MICLVSGLIPSAYGIFPEALPLWMRALLTRAAENPEVMAGLAGALEVYDEA